MNVGGEGFERLDGRVNVGCFGIVVIFHSANRGDVLQPVLDRFKVVHCFANPVGLAAQESADAHRSQNIFDVMPTLQGNLGDQHDLFLTTVIAEEDAAVVDKRALLDFSCPAEPEDLRSGAGCQFDAGQDHRR